MSVIRMCICCKKRELQSDLIRLQCIDKKLVRYTNFGRSFYICPKCVESDSKNASKALSRQCKQKIDISQMKEFLVYG